jgi:hypothetical protein
MTNDESQLGWPTWAAVKSGNYFSTPFKRTMLRKPGATVFLSSLRAVHYEKSAKKSPFKQEI